MGISVSLLSIAFGCLICALPQKSLNLVIIVEPPGFVMLYKYILVNN